MAIKTIGAEKFSQIKFIALIKIEEDEEEEESMLWFYWRPLICL